MRGHLNGLVRGAANEWCRKVAVSSPLELIGNCDRFSWSCLIFLYDKEDVTGVPENFVKH